MQDCTNKIIEYDDSVMFVYGTVVTDNPFYGKDVYHIGVDLNTDIITQSKDSYPKEAKVHELSNSQLQVLSKHLKLKTQLDKVIAVTGRARSGKDTVAEKLVFEVFPELLPANVTSVISHLGDPIREIDLIVSGKLPHKNRENLVAIGQGFRERDPNVWIKVWLRRAIEGLEKFGDNCTTYHIVPDIRQQNELTFFKSLGGISIKVEAVEEKRLQRIAELDGDDISNEDLLNNETEVSVDTLETDYTLYNNYDGKFVEDIKELFNNILLGGQSNK